ncbi:MAG: hypothetical protein RJA57_902 [Bacteroidota bacterium]
MDGSEKMIICWPMGPWQIVLPGTVFQGPSLSQKIWAMFEEYEKRKRKQVSQMRSLMDYGMGVLILLMGLFFLFRMQFPSLPVNQSLGRPDALEKVFGGISVVYGAWRIYRGYRKNYFK